MPERIQMSRHRPWRSDNPEAMIVARPSKWGNPWKIARVECHDGGLCWGTETKTIFGDWVTSHEHSTSAQDAATAAVTSYRHAILWPVSGEPGVPDLDDIRRELGGRDLACWCPLDQPCHADVLLELANPELAICVECRDGKHGACNGERFDESIDDWSPCKCEDRWHSESDPTEDPKYWSDDA